MHRLTAHVPTLPSLAVGGAAILALVTSGLAGSPPAHASQGKVHTDYPGGQFIEAKQTRSHLRLGFAGEDWVCFSGSRHGHRYRGRVNTVVGSSRGRASVKDIPATFEDPRGIRTSINYGYGTHRTEWLPSSGSLMRRVTGTSPKRVRAWCSR